MLSPAVQPPPRLAEQAYVKAPWMKVAEEELKKGVHELAVKDGFLDQLRWALTMDRSERKAHTKQLAEANAEIAKYFPVKTDPAHNKGKSGDIGPTYAGEWHADITPWCAAFVNWCLKTAEAPYLNFATAKSWLDFGKPVVRPIYGCITVMQPSESTDSTSAHVAFFVSRAAGIVKVLGGNQRKKVGINGYPENWVMKDGYRWPTAISQYLAAEEQHRPNAAGR